VAERSVEARELLTEASLDKNGTILRFRTMDGLGIQVNDRQFAEQGNPRSEAKWEAEPQLLIKHRLVQDLGHNGEVFTVTDRGYAIADRLRAGIGAA
jgi:hypothetical protein